jgi:hypothetical protein
MASCSVEKNIVYWKILDHIFSQISDNSFNDEINEDEMDKESSTNYYQDIGRTARREEPRGRKRNGN